MDLKILPLAITMMAGPQIMAAIVLVTTRQPVRISLAFLLGVLVGAAAGPPSLAVFSRSSAATS